MRKETRKMKNKTQMQTDILKDAKFTLMAW